MKKQRERRRNALVSVKVSGLIMLSDSKKLWPYPMKKRKHEYELTSRKHSFSSPTNTSILELENASERYILIM